MMSNEQLQALVEQISQEFFGHPFTHRAYFNNRLKTTGGRYLLASHDIELNQKMLTEHGLETLIGTIKHELCHYHLHLTGRGYRHRDREFKALLAQVSGLRFAPASQKRAKYCYRCEKCQTVYQRQRRINLQKFVCGRCRGKLVFVEKNL